MDEIERQMTEILLADPEFTFRDVLAELVKKGELAYEEAADPDRNAWLWIRFQRSKVRAGADRVNKDM